MEVINDQDIEICIQALLYDKNINFLDISGYEIKSEVSKSNKRKNANPEAPKCKKEKSTVCESRHNAATLQNRNPNGRFACGSKRPKFSPVCNN